MNFDFTNPSITDWIQSVGVLLTLPVLVWGVIKLFIKDKAKERKLSSLENIAERQQEIVDKMQEQINDLRYQSILMNEANDIERAKLELQEEVFEHQKAAGKIDGLKHLNEIKPGFQFHGSSSSSDGGFSIRLLNRRATAQRFSIENDSSQVIAIYPISDRLIVEKNQELQAQGRILNPGNLMVKASFRLLYEDAEGNKYYQTISMENRRYRVDDATQI